MILVAYAFALAFFMMVGYSRVKEPALALTLSTLVSIISWDLQQSYYGVMAALDAAVVSYIWLTVRNWNAACKVIAGLSLLSVVVNAMGYGLYMAYQPPSIYNFFAWVIIASQLLVLWTFRHGRLRAKSAMGTLFRFLGGDCVQYDHVPNQKEKRGK